MSNRIVHFEIPVDDQERANTFYRDAFGWDITSQPGTGYTLVTTGPSGATGPTEPGYINGGMFEREAPLANPIVVVDVPDIDATLAKIGDRGGSTVREKFAVGDMGFAAYFTDTEGNVVGLWETASG
jgi:predicted enzyme related to lactoylglutathione lyase